METQETVQKPCVYVWGLCISLFSLLVGFVGSCLEVGEVADIPGCAYGDVGAGAGLDRCEHLSAAPYFSPAFLVFSVLDWGSLRFNFPKGQISSYHLGWLPCCIGLGAGSGVLIPS